VIARLAPLALSALLLSACGGGSSESATPEPSRSAGVRDLSNVLELRAAFEAGRGKTRLLVLFSPT
jgi:hypothetical protein